jgi:fructose-1,6-bisphosphatase/inositol monophosphatase family enzyme
VTEADLAVQEYLLEAISKTDLVDCRLLAEEDTSNAKKFNEQGRYYLGIDPIDDTAIYAKGGKHFSTIVTLHDGKNILYAFVYFPAWDWTHIIVNNKYSVFGTTPDFTLPEGSEKAIVYWSGTPEKTLPEDALEYVKSRGLLFKPIASISSEYATIGSFITNKVAGVYHENMNAYDGPVELSIALAKGQKVFSGGPGGTLNLKDIRKSESGLHYQGYYLALNDVFSV